MNNNNIHSRVKSPMLSSFTLHSLVPSLCLRKAGVCLNGREELRKGSRRTPADPVTRMLCNHRSGRPRKLRGGSKVILPLRGRELLPVHEPVAGSTSAHRPNQLCHGEFELQRQKCLNQTRWKFLQRRVLSCSAGFTVVKSSLVLCVMMIIIIHINTFTVSLI